MFKRAENDAVNYEVAGITADGGSILTYAAVAANGSGLLVIDFLGVGPVKMLVFTAPTSKGGSTFDNGNNDYALAAISAVPVPASVLMLLSALGGLGGLGAMGGRRRTAAEA